MMPVPCGPRGWRPLGGSMVRAYEDFPLADYLTGLATTQNLLLVEVYICKPLAALIGQSVFIDLHFPCFQPWRLTVKEFLWHSHPRTFKS